MSDEDLPYAPPAGSPKEEESGSDPDEDRLPPPIFAPGTTRREIHRAPVRPPSLPEEVLYGPDDPPRSRPPRESPETATSSPPPAGAFIGTGKEARLADLLESLADELRRTGSVRFGADDRIEAALRGFLSGVLVD